MSACFSQGALSGLLKDKTILLAAQKRSVLTLDELVAPLLAKAGVKIRRYCHNAMPGSMEFVAGYRPLLEETLNRNHLDAVITVDDYHLTWIPADVPIISIPHASYQGGFLQNLFNGHNENIACTDFYFTQDDFTWPENKPELAPFLTHRPISDIRCVPIGSLKRDKLAETIQAQSRKDSILICGGYATFPIPSWEDTTLLVEQLLERYPRYAIVFRPFPDYVKDALPLRDRFAGEKRFLFDTSPSTTTYMPRAKTVIGFASTTGTAFSLASGEPHIQVWTNRPASIQKEELGYTCNNVQSALEALDILMGETKRNRDIVCQFRKKIAAHTQENIYQPGHAEKLFLNAVAAVIHGLPPDKEQKIPAMLIETRRRNSILNGLSMFDDMLKLPDFMRQAENTAISQLLFLNLLQLYQIFSIKRPIRPRLVTINSKSTSNTTQIAEALEAGNIPSNAPILLLGSPAHLIPQNRAFMEAHPGGFDIPTTPDILKAALRYAMENTFPVFLLQDENQDALTESFRLLNAVLRRIMEKG